MLTIFFRTVIIYIILMATLRLMGKRQLGELDVSEFVITILLSEIASLPITNTEIPLAFAIIPIATLVSFEIITSFLTLKFPWVKRILSARPTVIISRGRLDVKAMNDVRISVDELVSQLRQNGIYGLDEVDYAILEENGKMSIIPKNRNRPPDAATLGLNVCDSGVMHVVVSDGAINTHSIRLLRKDEKWVDTLLKKHNVILPDIICMTCNDAGGVFIIKKDGSHIVPKGK